MRTKIILVLAIVFGIISTVILTNYLKEIEDYKVERLNTIEVIVAKENIKENQLIKDDMLQTKEVPLEYLTPGYYVAKKDLVNRLSLAPISKNEVINSNRILAIDKSPNSLSQSVKKNYIGITVDVDNEQSIGQLVKPNDYVNIIYSQITGEDEAKNDVYESLTIFRNVKVLAIDRMLYVDSLTKEYQPYESITLEMTNQDAEALLKYKLQGEIGYVINSSIIN